MVFHLFLSIEKISLELDLSFARSIYIIFMSSIRIIIFTLRGLAISSISEFSTFLQPPNLALTFSLMVPNMAYVIFPSYNLIIIIFSLIVIYKTRKTLVKA